jgi:hypothetical protein
MALNGENELLVRKALAEIVETVPEAGYVIPAARYCSDINDYWTTRDASLESRREVESPLIDSTWVYPVSFQDDRSSGGHDSPLVKLDYEFYIFRQYGLEREDEGETPDVFGSKVLKQHNAFVAAWLGIKEAFQREAAIAALDEDIAVERKSTPVVQVEPIGNMAACEFVPRALGFSVRLRETVKLKLKEC